jgi:hypothetical protein
VFATGDRRTHDEGSRVRFRSTAARPIAAALLAAGVGAFGIQAASVAAPNPAAEQSVNASVPKNLPPASNSEGRLQPNTVHLLRLVEQLWPYYANGGVIGGYRQDPIADHPSGQALDIMMANGGRDAKSVAQGHQIAAFLTANANQLGIDYLVWRQSIWYPGQAWRLMEDRGDWTSNHMDHIHVKVYGDFQATDDIVLPSDLKVSPDSLPDGEALRIQHEQRVAAQQKVDAATARFDTATKTRKVLEKKNSKRADELAAAKLKVAGAIRQSYILGMDPELLNQAAIFLNSDQSDAAVLVAVERQVRTDRTDVTDAIDLLADVAVQIKTADEELADASSELKSAQDELALING